MYLLLYGPVLRHNMLHLRIQTLHNINKLSGGNYTQLTVKKYLLAVKISWKKVVTLEQQNRLDSLFP